MENILIAFQIASIITGLILLFCGIAEMAGAECFSGKSLKVMAISFVVSLATYIILYCCQ